MTYLTCRLLLMAAAFQYSLAVRYFAFAVLPNCFHRSPKTFGHTLVGVVTGFIPELLCSIFRHCHLLLPRFSPSPHLPILPNDSVFSYFSYSPYCIFSLLFRNLLPYFLFVYAIEPFTLAASALSF